MEDQHIFKKSFLDQVGRKERQAIENPNNT